MDNHPLYRLGVAGLQYDHRTAQMRDFLRAGAPLPLIPDEATSNSTKPFDWGMLGNDTKGCCVVSAIAHFIMSSSNGKIMPTAQQVLDLYFSLTGGVDSGLYPLDTFKKWRQNAWLGAPPILGFAAMNVHDHQMIKHACAAFGGVFPAWALPMTAQAQVGGVWDVVQTTGPGAPWTWGGHMTLKTDWTPRATGTFREATWGMVMQATERFVDTYCTELYAVIPDPAPPWFDKDKFDQYLADVGSVEP